MGSGANPGSHISYTMRPNNSSEAVGRGWGNLRPNGLEVKVQRTEEDKGKHAVPRKSRYAGAYLVHHIDKGLGGIPAQTTDRPNFRLALEDYLNERDDFVRGEGKAD